MKGSKIIMSEYKVAVYAICKNEEKFVDRWIDSMSEADGIFVTDTGSTDNTVQRLEDRGAIVNTVKLDVWRFDEARNISISYIPDDFDICVCTDLDEVFEKGWRELLEKTWVKDVTTRCKYKYTWSFNDDGTPGVNFMGEKIHTRHGFKWIHPVHEVLEYSGDRPDVYAEDEKIHLNHYPDDTKSRGQYLPLLELSVEEAPDDDRNVHYLGREYMFYHKWDKCIETLKRHLEMPKAKWLDERAASMRYIARAYRAKGDIWQSSSWLYRAIAEAPYLREGYVEMAQLAYTEGNWAKAYHMVDEALKITEPPKTYINEAFCWDYTVYDVGAISAYNLGMYEKSLEYAKTALKMKPDDERLKSNVQIIESKVNRLREE